MAEQVVNTVDQSTNNDQPALFTAGNRKIDKVTLENTLVQHVDTFINTYYRDKAPEMRQAFSNIINAIHDGKASIGIDGTLQINDGSLTNNPDKDGFDANGAIAYYVSDIANRLGEYQAPKPKEEEKKKYTGKTLTYNFLKTMVPDPSSLNQSWVTDYWLPLDEETQAEDGTRTRAYTNRLAMFNKFLDNEIANLSNYNDVQDFTSLDEVKNNLLDLKQRLADGEISAEDNLAFTRMGFDPGYFTTAGTPLTDEEKAALEAKKAEEAKKLAEEEAKQQAVVNQRTADYKRLANGDIEIDPNNPNYKWVIEDLARRNNVDLSKVKINKLIRKTRNGKTTFTWDISNKTADDYKAFSKETAVEDTARLVSFLGDLISLGGGGFNIAGTIGATGGDLVADISSKAGLWDTIKHLGENVFYGAIGMIPAAKLAKFTSKWGKSANTILGGLAGLGIINEGGYTYNMISDLLSGKKKDITSEDLKHLTQLGRSSTGAAAVGRNVMAARKYGKLEGENMHKITTKEGNEVYVSKEDAAKINKAGNSKGQKDADAAFKSAKKYDAEGKEIKIKETDGLKETSFKEKPGFIARQTARRVPFTQKRPLGTNVSEGTVKVQTQTQKAEIERLRTLREQNRGPWWSPREKGFDWRKDRPGMMFDYYFGKSQSTPKATSETPKTKTPKATSNKTTNKPYQAPTTTSRPIVGEKLAKEFERSRLASTYKPTGKTPEVLVEERMKAEAKSKAFEEQLAKQEAERAAKTAAAYQRIENLPKNSKGRINSVNKTRTGGYSTSGIKRWTDNLLKEVHQDLLNHPNKYSTEAANKIKAEYNSRFKKEQGGKFVQLLQFKREGGILKAQRGIQLNPNTSWYNDVFTPYMEHIIQQLQANSNYANWLNQMQGTHANLYQNASKTDFLNTAYRDDAVRAYQQDYLNDQYSTEDNRLEHGYNYGISNANRRGRYIREGKRTGNDWIDTGYEPDALYSGETDDRRILGRRINGQDDFSPEQLAAFNSRLKELGRHLYVDPTDNYYRIGSISDTGELLDMNGKPLTQQNTNEEPIAFEVEGPEVPDKPSDSSGINPVTPQWEAKIDRTPEIQELLTNSLGLTSVLGHIATTNHNYKTAVEALRRIRLLDYPQKYHQEQGDYAGNQLAEDLAARVINNSSKPTTSDRSFNAARQNEGVNKAIDILKEQRARDQKIRQQHAATSEQYANENNAIRIETGNKNGQLMYDLENKLADREQARRHANWTSVNNWLMEQKYRAQQKMDERKAILDNWRTNRLGTRNGWIRNQLALDNQYWNAVQEYQKVNASETATAEEKQAALRKVQELQATIRLQAGREWDQQYADLYGLPYYEYQDPYLQEVGMIRPSVATPTIHRKGGTVDAYVQAMKSSTSRANSADISERERLRARKADADRFMKSIWKAIDLYMQQSKNLKK